MGLIIDNFAGGGGASTGIEMALGRSPDIAINHSAEALAMHARNHPGTVHLVSDVWEVDPVEACAGRLVDLAWFSPDCTHHSRAKGGKPIERKGAAKSRALAWVVIRHHRAVGVRSGAPRRQQCLAAGGSCAGAGEPGQAGTNDKGEGSMSVFQKGKKWTDEYAARLDGGGE